MRSANHLRSLQNSDHESTTIITSGLITRRQIGERSNDCARLFRFCLCSGPVLVLQQCGAVFSVRIFLHPA